MKKLRRMACHLGVFICLYLVTAGLNALVKATVEPKGLCLFDWTTHERYWGLWILSLLLVLAEQDIWARFVTGGNMLAVLAGQIIGDLVEASLPADLYETRLYAGCLIWAGMVLLSILLGGLVQWWHDRDQD